MINVDISYDIEEIEEYIALPSAFMPFMKQVEEYLWKK